ncbi:MAG: energy transducer TonB [Terracidiphilus sp.]|jgi:TonB family protein
MRRILIASLLLAPLSSVAAFASSPATDANTPAQVTRVSTGVVPPRIIGSTDIVIPPNHYGSALPSQLLVHVNLNVDEAGNTQNVQVVNPLNHDLDARLVQAVQKLHFRPATLDHQNIPVAVNLNVVIQH